MPHPTFRLKRAYLAMRKSMDEALHTTGLTAAQFEVVQQLLHEDGLEHRVLQERLGLTSPSLTNVIDGLVEQGLVERRLSNLDARVKQLFLTSEAHQLHEALREAGGCFEKRMFTGFSQREIELFLEWLDQITLNLEDKG